MSKKLDEINKYRVNGYFDDSDQEWTDRESFDELLAHARALEEMLRRHEWILDSDDNERYCVECAEPQIKGHAPDCQLAKLLE